MTVTGLQARGTFARGPDQAIIGVSGPAAAIILSAAEGLAVIAFLVVLASARPQRKPKRDQDEPWRPAIPWWAKTLGVLLALAALVTPFAVLFTRKPRTPATRPLAGAPGVATGHVTAPPPGSAWPLVTGMVIAILVVLTLAVLSRRRRPAPSGRAGQRRLATLLDSLAAGRDALPGAASPGRRSLRVTPRWSAGSPPPGPRPAPPPRW